MQVQNVSNQNYNPKFNALYKEIRYFSKSQKIIAGALKKEFGKIIPSEKLPAIDYYKSKGYDFIVYPEENNKVLLGAVRGFKFKNDGESRYATFNHKHPKYIGVYDKNSVGFLLEDLKDKLKWYTKFFMDIV